MDIYNTVVLTGVVQSLVQPQSFMYNNYFKSEQLSSNELIAFDVESGARRMAPFVSPLSQGKVVKSKGRKTETLAPAYIKDKRPFDASRPLKRAIGEQIGGNLTPLDRIQINLKTELADQIDMITRRLEWMSMQALLTGKVTIVGEEYPAVLVDFGRDPNNTIVKAPGALWSDPSVNPLDDLATWTLQVLKGCGAQARDVYMTADVYKVFRENPFVQKRWNTLNKNAATLTMAALSDIGASYIGEIDGFNIFVYADWYIDPLDGVEKPMMPAGTVLLISPRVDGVRAFGAIRDEEAGYQSMPFFPKSWVEKDPSVRYLLMQSAPLPYPSRPNASLSAKVI